MTLSALLFGSVVALSLTEALSLACTNEEHHRISSMASGYKTGAFARLTFDCTIAATSVCGGIKKDVFLPCFTKVLNISTGCAHCWWVSGQYGYDHCKLPCIGSWCSKKCLTCSKPAVSGIIACAGFAGPEPVECDGVPNKVTGGQDVVSFLAHQVLGNGAFRLYTDYMSNGIAKAVAGTSQGAFLGLGLFGCAALVVAGVSRRARNSRRPVCDTFAEQTEENVAFIPEQNEDLDA